MQDQEFFDNEDVEETPDIELPHRKESPYHKKQRDYKHEARTLSSGNRGYRKALKLLPHLERRSYRHTLNTATKAAGGDEDAELTSADKLKTYKRSMFSRLVDRKSVPLKDAIKARKESREARSNRRGAAN